MPPNFTLVALYGLYDSVFYFSFNTQQTPVADGSQH